MRVLGIAGTAKNTGKTTATVSLINNWQNYSRLAVTSIGYDGESKDNVTGLPKPRLHLPAGVWVVTAEKCLSAGSAGLAVIEFTQQRTPLGRLVVVRVQTPGLVVLAGPNSERALKWFIEYLRSRDLEMLIVDGALNRLAPMAAADSLVISTGAARNRDLQALAAEAEAIETLMTLPQCENPRPTLKLGSLLVDQQVPDVLRQIDSQPLVEFSGIVDSKPLRKLLAKLPGEPAIVLNDSIKLLLSGDLIDTAALVTNYQGVFQVRKSVQLRAVTVNPFFPRYNEANGQYSPDFVDHQLLLDLVRDKLQVPVIDVVRQQGALVATV
ncbi:MAG: hypothetical protein FH749_04890 [Firmicutes bacterium]|nr:hypothetical protein [Bacillota bacterium]